MIRSQQSPMVTVGEYVYLVDAAYGSGNRPVCGICWSELDFTWGHDDPEHELLKSKRGKDADYLDKDGEVWLVWKDAYRCGNPECDGASVIRSIPAKLSFDTPWHPEDIKARSVVNEPLFKQGFYDDHGVFWIEENGQYFHVDTVDGEREIDTEYKHPWLYIDAGNVMDDAPDTWARDDTGRLKVSVNGKRFDQVLKWFALRNIQLPDPRT